MQQGHSVDPYRSPFYDPLLPIHPMKKVSLLVGALGGAFAGYLFSNKKLRDELHDAKDGEEAARILARHVKDDGKKIGKEAWAFVQSDEVQHNLGKAKKFAEKQFKIAKREVGSFVQKEAKEATKAVKKAIKKAGR